MDCPKCGTKCEAEHVDIGVGEQRVEPWGCPACHWVEPTAEDEFGFVDDADFQCPTCKGSGRVNPLTAPKDFFCVAATDCPHCDGTGEV